VFGENVAPVDSLIERSNKPPPAIPKPFRALGPIQSNVYDLIPLAARLKSARCTIKQLDPITTTPESRERVTALVERIRQGGYAADSVTDELAHSKDDDGLEDRLAPSIAELQGALLADKMLFAVGEGRHMSTEDWITLQRFVGQLTSKTSKRGRGQFARDESLISLIETLRDPEGAIKSMKRQELPSTEVMGLRQEIANQSVTADEAIERVRDIEAQELRDGLAKVTKSARYQAHEIKRLRKLLHSEKTLMADLEKANGKLLQYQANEKLRRVEEDRKVREEKGKIYKAKNEAIAGIKAAKEAHEAFVGIWATLFIVSAIVLALLWRSLPTPPKTKEKTKQMAAPASRVQVGNEPSKTYRGSGSQVERVAELAAKTATVFLVVVIVGAVMSRVSPAPGQ
jgi:preprotein translocase subunit SecG